MRSLALTLAAALPVFGLPASDSQDVPSVDSPAKRSPENVIPMLFASLNAKLGSTIPLPTVWHTTAPHLFPDPSVPTSSPQAAVPPPQVATPLPPPPPPPTSASPPPPPATAAAAAPAAPAVSGILGLLLTPVFSSPIPEAPGPAVSTPAVESDPGAAQDPAPPAAPETDPMPSPVEPPTSMITPSPDPAADPAANRDVCLHVLVKDMNTGKMMCVSYDKAVNALVTSTMPAGAAERERARAKARKEEEKNKKKEEDARKKKEKEDQKKKGSS